MTSGSAAAAAEPKATEVIVGPCSTTSGSAFRFAVVPSNSHAARSTVRGGRSVKIICPCLPFWARGCHTAFCASRKAAGARAESPVTRASAGGTLPAPPTADTIQRPPAGTVTRSTDLGRNDDTLTRNIKPRPASTPDKSQSSCGRWELGSHRPSRALSASVSAKPARPPTLFSGGWPTREALLVLLRSESVGRVA